MSSSFAQCLNILAFFQILALPVRSEVALVVNNAPINAGDARDVGLIPVLERSPGEGNGNALQYSCMENPMDREA